MATHPIVRNTEEEAVRSPQELEALIGPGVSPEHRAFLLKALTQTNGRKFFEALASMPDVGEDSDFAPYRG
jgi:hypothetical protein